jgi:hypothetical protein
MGEPIDLLGGLLGRPLVVVSDGNQICHVTLLRLGCLQAAAYRTGAADGFALSRLFS